jgi:hypothetical protein
MRILYKMVGGRTMNGRGRNLNSLVNRTNTMGGPKKQGLPPTIGLDSTISGVYRQRIGCLCPTAYDFINRNIVCGTTVGGLVVRPRC